MKSFDKKLVLIILIVVFSVAAFFYMFDRPQSTDPQDETLSMEDFFVGNDDRSGVRNAAGNLMVSIIKRDENTGTVADADGAISIAENESVDLFIKIADTQELRSRGLQGVESLTAEMEGMLFVYPSNTEASFWMKEMLMPLSIAFISSEGTILEIMDLPVCRQEICPTYRPEGSYRYALEVEQGWFAGRQVSPGDKIVLPNK